MFRDLILATINPKSWEERKREIEKPNDSLVLSAHMSSVTEIACLALKPSKTAGDPALREAWATAQQELKAASGIEFNFWEDIRSSKYIYMVGGWADRDLQAVHVREHGAALLKPFTPFLARHFAHHFPVSIDSVPRHANLLVVTICTVLDQQKSQFEDRIERVQRTLTLAGHHNTGGFDHRFKKPADLGYVAEGEDPVLPATRTWVSCSGCDSEEQGVQLVNQFHELLRQGESVGFVGAETVYLRKYL